MNITPLVDVMLVLLVIFMVATPMVAGRIDARIPQLHDGPAPDHPPRQVTLTVDGQGQFRLDGVAYGRADLPLALSNLALGDPRAVVQISANADAEYQDFAWTLAEDQHAGIQQIALQ